jgi:hypothetical protein
MYSFPLTFKDDLLTSDWIEWNGNGVNQCYIQINCSIQITLKDAYGNIENIPNLLTLQMMDALIIGPYNSTVAKQTLYIQDFDASQSA